VGFMRIANLQSLIVKFGAAAPRAGDGVWFPIIYGAWFSIISCPQGAAKVANRKKTDTPVSYHPAHHSLFAVRHFLLHFPSLGRISTIFCLPSTTSARKLARSMSPFWSQLASIRIPGEVSGFKVRPFIARAKALLSNLPIFSV